MVTGPQFILTVPLSTPVGTGEESGELKELLGAGLKEIGILSQSFNCTKCLARHFVQLKLWDKIPISFNPAPSNSLSSPDSSPVPTGVERGTVRMNWGPVTIVGVGGCSVNFWGDHMVFRENNRG